MEYDVHEYQPQSPTMGGCEVCGLSRHNPVHDVDDGLCEGCGGEGVLLGVDPINPPTCPLCAGTGQNA